MKRHPKYNEYSITTDGRVYSHLKSRFLSQHLNQGYLQVSTIYGHKRVHRLVAETYIPNHENKREVNHIDGVKSNNFVENLEWCTSKENKTHAHRLGLYEKSKWFNHHSVKLTEVQVHTICKMLQDGFRNNDIAKELNLHKDFIANIRNGRSFKCISSQYTFSVTRKNRKAVKTVKKIADLLSQGVLPKDIARLTGQSISEIHRIKRREIYKDILKDYDF